jgi:WD40 repeat protein
MIYWLLFISVVLGNACLVSEAHHTGELWGLCVHPLDPDLFVTCGDDRTLRIWSITHRRVIRKAILDCTARSVAWSSDGRSLIVGTILSIIIPSYSD